MVKRIWLRDDAGGIGNDTNSSNRRGTNDDDHLVETDEVVEVVEEEEQQQVEDAWAVGHEEAAVVKCLIFKSCETEI